MPGIRSTCAAACAALATLVPAASHADWKPTKPVESIVHTGPGGGNDLLARAVVNMMEQEKLVPVRMQVLNRPGGGGAVAAAAIADRAADRNTRGCSTNVWLARP